MVVKHCVYKDCESDSRYWEREYMRGVCFIRFPNVLTNRERCEKWVKACDRKDFTIDEVNDKTYICSKHFLGGNGPTITSTDPLSPKQLFEANLRHKTLENSNAINSLTNNSKTLNENSFYNINNNINSGSHKITANGFTQHFKLREIESFKSNNICDKNDSVINVNNTLISANKSLNESTNSTTVNNMNESSLSSFNELKQEPKHQSDESLKDNYECINKLMTDSMFMPSIASNTIINNSSLLLSELSNNDNNNSTEVTNNSLPFIIIPSTNHTMIGSTFSVPVMHINEKKRWFNQFINSEMSQKLAKHELSVGHIGHRLIFSSISGCIVDKQLIIDISGNFDVKVFGVSLYAKNNFYKCVPIVINNELEFNSVIDNFCLWKVCVANHIKDGVFQDKIIAIRASICNTSNTIRSKSCELLIPNNGSIRCKCCKIILSRIRRFK